MDKTTPQAAAQMLFTAQVAQTAQAALAPSQTLPRSQRLTSRRAIDALFASGTGGFVYPIRYVILPSESTCGPASPPSETEATPEAAILVSVPKRNHKQAHVRNLLKRRLREAYRLHKEPLRGRCRSDHQGLSLGLLYAAKEVTEYSVIEQAVQKILQIVVPRA